jgi:uncharacterized protein YndB with AHSA1/START domain
MEILNRSLLTRASVAGLPNYRAFSIGRIVLTTWIEHEGAVVFEVLQTVTFTDLGSRTELRLEHRVTRNDGFPGAEGARVGWEQTLARLAAYVEGGHAAP